MTSGFIGRHARSLIFVCFALAAAGVVAATSMPIGLFPQIAFPRVVVDLDAGQRPADQMALLVTRPVEQAIRAVPGVQEVRSQTSRGTAQISVDFGWGRDMIASTLLVNTALSQILPSLPGGTNYTVRRMDPTVFPIISYALRPVDTKAPSPTALRDLAQLQIVPLLSSIPGLAQVVVQGGDTAEIEVEANLHHLAAYGLSVADLGTAIAGQAVVQAVGRIQDRDKLYLAVAQNAPNTAEDIGALVVRVTPGGVVRVRDVAQVSMGTVPQWVHVEADGVPSVLMNVYEQPDGNAVAIAAAVRQKLGSMALPSGVVLDKWYDQSTLVTASASSVRDAVLIGLVLAGIVLLAFLRNWRMTLIAALVVPATLAITVLILRIMGMSFNIMTLGGIAAAVGLLIDDVIVMVEHIARRAGGTEGTGNGSIFDAAQEFLRPLTGSSLATLIVFIPLSFLSGVTGAFSGPLSKTMAVALIVSFFVTWLVVPLLADKMIDFSRWQDPHKAEGWLERAHRRVLHALFARPILLGAAIIPLLVIGYVGYQAVPTGFMPAVDEGGFVLDYYTAPGTSLIETEREMAQVDALIKAMPETQTFSRRLGTGLGSDLGQSYHGDYFVELKSGHARTTPQVMADLLAEIQNKVPGIQVDTAQPMEDLIGDLTAVPQPIEIKLFAADPAALVPEATKVANAIAKIPGIVEVNNGIKLAGDALMIDVDPIRAGRENMSPSAVSKSVSDALSGYIAAMLPESLKVVGVRVRISNALAARIPDLTNLPIRAPDGHVFPLDRVATISPVSGQPQISRDNLQPMIAVTARIQGQGIGGAIAEVKHALAQNGMLAPGMRYELGGLYAQQQIAFAGLTKVFAAALIAEFILLLFLYEQFWMPVVIIVCSLLSSTTVFAALWATSVELNITALMGLTMVIGIGTEMAIFYASEYAALRAHMPQREALMMAAHNRLRPILMTTLAALLTLLPLAFAIGQGSGMQQPLAIAIIAGLCLQCPLVLIGLPVLIGLRNSKT